MSTQVVWFKKDLRIRDHRPLADAAQRGPVICLYVYEPHLYADPEFHTARLRFINTCLRELDERLRKRGGRLIRRVGHVPEVLDALLRAHAIDHLWSHQETGRYATYERDEAVRDWADRHNVPWTEHPQNGVVRGLNSRDGWADRWEERHARQIVDPPETLRTPDEVDAGQEFTSSDLDRDDPPKPEAQQGGVVRANEILDSFLEKRGKSYRSGMSSPVTAWDDCSRLSPHLTFGTLSMKQVYQRTSARQEELEKMKERGEQVDGDWMQSLSMFVGRLHWHCHFMQKLEDEPRIEFENLARSYDGLREDEFDEDDFRAWKQGVTGFPMIDACMRALHRSGWINFRMRAMLMSFSSYHLWQHWRRPGQWLARQFLDFEPGIHWPQVQMQSGTTGINSIRIYNPTKQVHDHDPDGDFIREYVPELQEVPGAYIAEPHKMTAADQEKAGCEIGTDYPEPIVDGKQAWKRANERIWEVKSSEQAKQEADEIYEKHGSRRGPG